MAKRKRQPRVPARRVPSSVAGRQELDKAAKGIREILLDPALDEKDKTNALQKLREQLRQRLALRASIPLVEADKLAVAWIEKVAFDVTDRLHQVTAEDFSL